MGNFARGRFIQSDIWEAGINLDKLGGKVYLDRHLEIRDLPNQTFSKEASINEGLDSPSRTFRKLV